jgi:hypothetical protein
MKKEIKEEFLKEWKECQDTLADLDIFMEQMYCSFNSKPTKEFIKEFKKNHRKLKDTLTQMIQRKKLKIS